MFTLLLHNLIFWTFYRVSPSSTGKQKAEILSNEKDESAQTTDEVVDLASSNKQNASNLVNLIYNEHGYFSRDFHISIRLEDQVPDEVSDTSGQDDSASTEESIDEHFSENQVKTLLVLCITSSELNSFGIYFLSQLFNHFFNVCL